jgi:hypothetical protein
LKQTKTERTFESMAALNFLHRIDVAASMTAEKTSPIKQNERKDLRLDNLKKIWQTNRTKNLRIDNMNQNLLAIC